MADGDVIARATADRIAAQTTRQRVIGAAATQAVRARRAGAIHAKHRIAAQAEIFNPLIAALRRIRLTIGGGGGGVEGGQIIRKSLLLTQQGAAGIIQPGRVETRLGGEVGRGVSRTA